MIYKPRGRGAMAAVSAGVTLLSVLTLNTAEAQPEHGGGAHPAQSPWTDAGYQPRPGDWRPYVLAPKGHDVKPASVSSVSAARRFHPGRPQSAARQDQEALRLVSSGDRTQSPLVTLDFGKDVGGEIRIRVTGASKTRPSCTCASANRRQFAASPAQTQRR